MKKIFIIVIAALISACSSHERGSANIQGGAIIPATGITA
jgi:hypothetical protein